MHEEKIGNKHFDLDHFSALQDFLGGYLHEDFVEEYGSADGSVENF